MVKKIICTLLFIAAVKLATAQLINIDSLQKEIRITQNDTVRLVLLNNISRIYAETNPDSALYSAGKALAIARKINFKLEEARALREMAYALINLGNYTRSLQTLLNLNSILEDPKSEQNVLFGKYPGDDEITNRSASPQAQRFGELAFAHQVMGVLYINTYNYEKALFYHYESLQWAIRSGNIPVQSIIYLTLGNVYLNLKKPDSALVAEQKAFDLAMQISYKRYIGSILLNMGRINVVKGNLRLAGEYFRKALIASADQKYFRGVVASNLLLARYYNQSGKIDSGFHSIKDALSVAQFLDAPDLLLRVDTAMAGYYRSIHNKDSTLKYQALIIRMKDSLFNLKQAQQFQNIDFDEQQRQQQIKDATTAFRNQLRIYVLLAGLGIFLFVAIILWRNSHQRKIANALLSKQKEELESALKTLKATQNQLIQSEKMASLGELTAGIAHEIQNPLNFVNNFSEVNKELLAEMKNEMDKGNLDDIKAIANDVISNEEKISHHGKRADAIVKGMLLHSRTSIGEKEPTDINKLADSYLQLAYRGLRSKDKFFNATMKTDYDETIGNISIIPQDIGMVILNLINNAFYAVDEKRKQQPEGSSVEAFAKAGYEPTVSISTKKINSKIEIRVTDNGNGIPKKILDKIFQPFFTTKPAGEGTGLGLSLAYDTVKAHGGELKLETKEGEGAEFIIELPIK